MYLEPKETARLYKLLSEKLGNDTTEAMFKYIDNKTERSVEASIKTLSTKDDLANLRKEVGNDFSNLRKEMGDNFSNLRKEMGDNFSNFRKEMGKEISNVKDEIANVRYDLRKDIGESKADNIKWMFIFWVGQIGATLAILLLFLKK
jgi:hypothetical protein